MKKYRVLKPNNLPARLPLYSTILFYLLLDKISAPMWLWGAMGLLFLLLWVVAIIRMADEERIDLLKNDKP